VIAEHRCLLGAAALTIACGFPVKVGNLDAQVEDTGTEGTFDPSDPTTTGESGDPPPPAVRNDFAIRLRDIPEGDEGGMSDVASSADSGGGDSSGSDTGGIGNPFDPDALMVVATLGSSTCQDPFALESVCSTWRLSFNLPPELQFAGASVPLADINGAFISTEPGDEGECSGGGTVEGLSGQMLITGIDETRVSARITETVAPPFGSELDIDALRCN
jgi:hypothetical protein